MPPGTSRGRRTNFSRDSEALRDPAQVVAHWDAVAHLEASQLAVRASPGWWDLLHQLDVTVLVTREYENFMLALSAAAEGGRVSYLRVPHPSGVAVDRRSGTVHLAATRNPNQVITLRPTTAGVLVPTAARFYPGGLYLHDLAVVEGRLLGAAVGCNSVVDLDAEPARRLWWPRSLDALEEGALNTNHLQLNSIAVADELGGCFFTASVERPGRRRPGHLDWKVDRQGVLFAGDTREVVARGLTRPHSARLHRGRVWVDDSGYGELVIRDGDRFQTVAKLPGWTRGLTFVGDVALVGTSRVIPRFRRYAPGVREELCGVHAVDTRTGRILTSVRFPAGNQIFGLEWYPRQVARGLPFRYGSGRRRLEESRRLFYDFQIRSST